MCLNASGEQRFTDPPLGTLDRGCSNPPNVRGESQQEPGRGPEAAGGAGGLTNGDRYDDKIVRCSRCRLMTPRIHWDGDKHAVSAVL